MWLKSGEQRRVLIMTKANGVMFSHMPEHFKPNTIVTVGLKILSKSSFIIFEDGKRTWSRCNRLKCPCPPACKFPIRIITTPYRFIPWPLWPMLALEAGQSNQGHLSLLHRYEAVMDPFVVGAHILLHSDGLRTCACRLDNIFRSGNIYVGAAIYISEWQYIFQTGNTYLRGGGMHTVRTRWGHGENDKLELYEDGEIGMCPVTNEKKSRYYETAPSTRIQWISFKFDMWIDTPWGTLLLKFDTPRVLEKLYSQPNISNAISP